MGLNVYTMYVLAFAIALTLSIISIPQIIYVAKRKRLVDMPDNHRKLHTRIVPNLGGIGIFFAFIIAATIFIIPSILPQSQYFSAVQTLTKWNYLVAGALILFITGIKDDLVTISPTKKFIAQAVAGFFVAFFADVRITDFHGLLMMHQLPVWFSIAFTIIGIMFVTNAFNLIDGIDGLAGSISALASLVLGICLAAEGNPGGAVIAFSLLGAVCGFLRYNIAPAKIFMGDTGSLLLGFVLSVLAIMFLQGYHAGSAFAGFMPDVKATLPAALAILFVPIFDTFRVFTTRILKGRSPFHPDRTHLHHYLLDLGLNHSKTVSIIVTANVFIILICGMVYQYNIHLAVLSLFVVAFGLFGIVFFLRRQKLGKPAPQVVHTDMAPKNISRLRNALRFSRRNKEAHILSDINISNLTINGNKIQATRTITEDTVLQAD